MSKLGFIGCGNMATAIINGAVSSGFIEGENVFVFDVDSDKTNELKEKCGVNICNSAEQVVRSTLVTVLAVKPQVFPEVLPQIASAVAECSTAIVSIGAGKTLNYIGSFLDDDAKIVRVMPNINARVGASMSGICGNKNVNENLLTFVKELCRSFGEVMELDEEMFPLFGVIAGCSPAYSFMFIDSMAREAVKNGMNKKDALKICAQAVLGSAKTILEDENANAWALINNVCSPGGTTIEGIAVLEKEEFPEAVMNAVKASLEKDKKL